MLNLDPIKLAVSGLVAALERFGLAANEVSAAKVPDPTRYMHSHARRATISEAITRYAKSTRREQAAAFPLIRMWLKRYSADFLGLDREAIIAGEWRGNRTELKALLT